MQKINLLTILLLTVKEITSKVSINTNFTGIHFKRDQGKGQLNQNLTIDLTQYFNLRDSKNPEFSIKESTQGEILTTNDVQSSLKMDERSIYFYMELANYIGMVVGTDTLRLIKLGLNGEIENQRDIPLGKTDVENCFDMAYVESKKAIILGCVDTPQNAVLQRYFVYSFERDEIIYTEYDQSNDNPLEIEGQMVDAGDGVFCYLQGVGITPFFYWKINRDYTLGQEIIDYTFIQTIDYPILTFRHEYYIKNNEWMRRLVTVLSTPNGLEVYAYDISKNSEGAWIAKRVDTGKSRIVEGPSLFSRANQPFIWQFDVYSFDLVHCRTYGGRSLKDYFQECEKHPNVNIGYIDLSPVRVSTGDQRLAFLHFRTWPRETIGGSSLVPGMQLYPTFTHITQDYSLNDFWNYTMYQDNVYSFTPDKVSQYRIRNPQFKANLQLTSDNNEVEIICKDEDNEVSLKFTLELYNGLGKVDIGIEKATVTGKVGSVQSFEIFKEAWKGNMIKAGSFKDDYLFINDQGSLEIFDVENSRKITPGSNDVFFFSQNKFLKITEGRLEQYNITKFIGNQLQVTLVNNTTIEYDFIGNENFECKGEYCKLTTTDSRNNTGFYLMTSEGKSKYRVQPPSKTTSGENPVTIEHTSDLLIKHSGPVTNILTAFISDVIMPPFRESRRQIEIMKLVNGVGKDYYPNSVTVHSSSLYNFCPRSLSYIHNSNNVISILSACPQNNPNDPFLVDIIHGKLDDLDFVITSKNALNLDQEAMNTINDAHICRIGNAELLIISKEGNWVYSIDIKNPQNFRKIDFSNFGESLNLTDFRCLQEAGTLALIFTNGVGLLKGGEVFNTTSRFKAFIKTQNFVRSVDTVEIGKERILVVKDGYPVKLSYYNIGVPTLYANFTKAQAGKTVYNLNIGNSEDEKNIEIEVDIEEKAKSEQEVLVF